MARDCMMREWRQSISAAADAAGGTCSDMQQRRIVSSLMPVAAAVRESNSVIVWNSKAGCGGGPRMRTRQPIACKRGIRLSGSVLAGTALPCEQDARLHRFASTDHLTRCEQCRGRTCMNCFRINMGKQRDKE